MWRMLGGGGGKGEWSKWNGRKERRYVEGRSVKDVKKMEETKRQEGTKMERSDVPLRLKFFTF